MPLTAAQIDKLLDLVSATLDDCLDCDGCFEQVAEFAESELTDRPLSEAQQSVRTHLESCPCCEDEYQALLDGLQAMGE